MSAPAPPCRLSGIVVCRNEARRIEACLESLAFCDEVVVVDSGSTDGTPELARAKGARVVTRPFHNINDQKDHARTLARGTWVLNLDADEVVTPELRAEVEALVARGGDPGIAAYLIPFRNHFRTAWVRRSGYYPDPHVRLLKRDAARWDVTAPVHDLVLADGAIGRLTGHVDHHSFESIAHFVEKSSRYADAFARAAHAKGRRSGPGTIALHTIGRFFRAYVLKLGVLEGALGLVISGLQAYEVFQKYVRLWELQRFGPPPERAPTAPAIGEGARGER
ncbi:glycosyltransferase family 2 protein [Myxococcota bacterium]|nr:glycosyltransferase family 2 protein [Myxococcota bacterium]